MAFADRELPSAEMELAERPILVFAACNLERFERSGFCNSVGLNFVNGGRNFYETYRDGFRCRMSHMWICKRARSREGCAGKDADGAVPTIDPARHPRNAGRRSDVRRDCERRSLYGAAD